MANMNGVFETARHEISDWLDHQAVHGDFDSAISRAGKIKLDGKVSDYLPIIARTPARR